MSAATVEAHIRWEANPGKVGTLVSLRLRKDLEGRRVGSQGRAERVRRRRRSGWSSDHESRLGLKALLLSNARRSRKTQPPEAPAFPGRAPSGRTRLWREEKSVALLSHRNMGTLKIHAMSPVHYVYARPARARGRTRKENADGGEHPRHPARSRPPGEGRGVRAGRGGAGRGKRGKGPGGRPRGSSKPQVRSFPQPPPIFIAASPPAGRGRA